MTFDEYQAAAARTSAAPFPERERPLVQCLGLCGESGELADLIKKAAWHGQPLSRERFIDEAGDVLWYLSDLATHYRVSLDEIASGNIHKLTERYPDGFTVGGGNR
jgi:NTP pyrophosphatase (non-canonical NTP hydrolase)